MERENSIVRRRSSYRGGGKLVYKEAAQLKMQKREREERDVDRNNPYERR